MKGNRLEKEAKAGASAAKTIAKWEAELASLEAEAERYAAAEAQVDRLHFPPITKDDDGKRITFRMGDAKVYYPKTFGSMSHSAEQERVRALENVWRKNRLRERGVNPSKRHPKLEAKELKGKLDKKKAALKRLMM
jgi:hypothetical protein